MKNKEITMYELIGLIKDDKAPKEIKFKNEIFYLNKDSYSLENLYLNESGIEMYNRNNIFLDDTVEILPEENDDWEDIEDITLNGETIGYGILNEWLDFSINNNEQKICSCIETLGIAMNKLIKNQKYLKERLDKNENK